jgi:chemotaxis protein methyltransferase WspC
MSARGLPTGFQLGPGFLGRLEKQLAERFGLETKVVGRDAVSCAVRRRMMALDVTRAEEYEQRLTSQAEWVEIMEALLVSETWFFREAEAFASLSDHALGQWLPANPSATLRLLSIPCASGEEPFSTVIALQDAGFPQNRLHVDAVDIGSSVLAEAERGVYGARSFRTSDLSFRARYFEPMARGFLLDKAVRDRVRFLQGNLLDIEFVSGLGRYDFIFCRNLLIYLHKTARRQVLSRIQNLLAHNGILFVGLAEQLLVQEHGFEPAGGTPTCSLFRLKASRREDELVHGRAKRNRPRCQTSSADTTRSPRMSALQARTGSETRPPRPARVDPLQEARRLADAGKLREAAALCEVGLRENNTSAGAYYLLGLIREAEGAPGAAQYYRKALYLEPNHREALLQMALLARKQGDLAGAHLFWSRAERGQPGTNQL